MLAKLKIAQKLYLLTGLTLAFLLVASAIGYMGAMNLGDLFKQYRDTSRASMLLSNVVEDVLEVRLAALKYRATPDEAHVEAVESNLAQIEAARSKIATVIQDPDTQAKLKKLKTDMQGYGVAFERAVGADPEVVEQVFTNKLDVIGPRVIEELDQIQDRLQETQNTLGPAARAKVVWTEREILVVSALAVLLSAAVAFLISRAIARPVGRLTDVMSGIAETERTDVTVPSQDARDEVGDMARALETFRGKLEEKSRLEAEQAEREQQAQAEKRQAMLELADGFETQVGQVVDAVSSAATEMQNKWSTRCPRPPPRCRTRHNPSVRPRSRPPNRRSRSARPPSKLRRTCRRSPAPRRNLPVRSRRSAGR
jgi:HAMP domain-containing protein